MCQAYEGERASIVASEQRATKEGYNAAKNGQPKSNPYDRRWDMYRHDAWNHGYGCFEEGIIPYCMEAP
jgi:hypothetical protein